MTAKQITELHDLCLQINLFAERHKQAPIAMYHMIGDENPFTTMICIEIYQTEPFNIIKTFTFSTDTISTEEVENYNNEEFIAILTALGSNTKILINGSADFEIRHSWNNGEPYINIVTKEKDR